VELETPTSQPTGSGSHEIFGPANGSNLTEKPLPVRKTRAEIATRKLTSRNTRDISNDGKRSTASQDSGSQAPARRSTRLTSKFTSKLGVGTERETRLGAKEREREAKKAKTIGSRSRSLHLGGNSVAAKEREKERERGNSEDINVRTPGCATEHRVANLGIRCPMLPRYGPTSLPGHRSILRNRRRNFSFWTSSRNLELDISILAGFVAKKLSMHLIRYLQVRKRHLGSRVSLEGLIMKWPIMRRFVAVFLAVSA
jgi:hypothetical protein